MPLTAATAGLLVVGLALGGGIGVALERSHFCTMGAIADVVLFGSWRRARTWAGMAALAIVATQSMTLLGWPGLAAQGWPAAGLAGAFGGGLAFGCGMVLAGGCASRLWVRAGSASAKAWAALAASAAGAVAVGATVPVETSAVDLPPVIRLASLVVSLGAVAWVIGGRPAAERSGERAGLVLIVVAAVVVGWLVTTPFGPGTSVNYVPPIGTAGSAPARGFAVAFLVGTLAGAAVSAHRAGRFGRERVADADDLRRHLVGGAAMGVGGGLTGGCTLGAGVAGVGLLAPTAMAAAVGMIAGAAWMVHVLASGGWRAAWRALRS